MSNWFETIVPNDRTWSYENIKYRKELVKGGAQDISEYLSYVLSHTSDTELDTDHFTAVVNIRNGFIPSNGDYSGFSIQIEGTVRGEYVDKTVIGSSDPVGNRFVWNVHKIEFFVSGSRENEANKRTVLNAGNDYIMRAYTSGDHWNPGNGEGARYGAWWAEHGEFNPKITPAALASIKAALNKNPGEENI